MSDENVETIENVENEEKVENVENEEKVEDGEKDEGLASSVKMSPLGGVTAVTKWKWDMYNFFLTNFCRFSYEAMQSTAKYLKDRVPFVPKVGIICGSGMGSIADALTCQIKFPYKTIPNFPVSTVHGHAGELVFGYLNEIPVVCMKGRFHYYEGYPLWKCSMPVRVMKLVGVTHLIATNAAGGLNPKYKEGDIMIMKDHINLMGFAGNNPLQGPNDERFGPRFPPMCKAYDRRLLILAKAVANKLGIADIVHEGVYTSVGGPNFETVAELRMLKLVGVDAVGMSTVHEVITAKHCDLTVFAFSLITNVCATEYNSEIQANHQEVMDVGKMREEVLRNFVSEIVLHIGHSDCLNQSDCVVPDPVCGARK